MLEGFLGDLVIYKSRNYSTYVVTFYQFPFCNHSESITQLNLIEICIALLYGTIDQTDTHHHVLSAIDSQFPFTAPCTMHTCNVPAKTPSPLDFTQKDVD